METMLLMPLVVCVLMSERVQAYSSGAPSGACVTMTPNHGANPQQVASPYKVTTSKQLVTPGDQVQVTLGGSGPFKGFFIRAQQSGNFIKGQFMATSEAQLRCNSEGITHKGSNLKNKVTVTWTAPDDIQATPVTFVATVVEQRQTFWTFVRSSEVTVEIPPSSPGNPQDSMGSAGNSSDSMGAGSTGDDDDDDDGDDGDGNRGHVTEVGGEWLWILIPSVFLVLSGYASS